jgi:hypothetical protein
MRKRIGEKIRDRSMLNSDPEWESDIGAEVGAREAMKSTCDEKDAMEAKARYIKQGRRAPQKDATILLSGTRNHYPFQMKIVTPLISHYCEE